MSASPHVQRGPQPAATGAAQGISIEAAYAECRRIARREAKNFYYAFRALPEAKRNAICAVYAFMRHADDLSDDESLPHARRRALLDAWLADWHRAEAGGTTNDPVFIALADAQRRFAISSQWLEQLVEGTAMDLCKPLDEQRRGPSMHSDSVHPLQFDTYTSFDELYRYCYLVASVVGLVCIRIFGYQDPRAEKLAEETGIAFQLTNILRDVREDAERGRVYLPLDEMEQQGVTPDELAHAKGRHSITVNQRVLLEMQAARAEHYYQSGYALLPLIEPDSRPALWVLITIYHRLLERIRRHNYDVFSQRVSVPTVEKLWILARGLFRVFAWRLFGAQ